MNESDVDLDTEDPVCLNLSKSDLGTEAEAPTLMQ